MVGNMLQGGLLSSVSGGLDFQGQMENNHQGPPNLHPSVGNGPHHDQRISIGDLCRGEKNKNSASEEDDPSFIEEGLDGNGDKKGLPWQRVKWTDKMVKLLITAVSYMSVDSSSDFMNGGRRQIAILQRKGKWKWISKVMAERGCHVSPQQCEDKFNDLNKRYKKLNDILGRGTSCQVVENPVLLDWMNHVSDRDKDEVRKILSSNQLFYEEMCSYHNGNRLYLPHDPELQHSLQAAIRNRKDPDPDHKDVRGNQCDARDVEMVDHNNFEDNHASQIDGRSMSKNKLKQCEVQEGVTSNPHTQVLPEISGLKKQRIKYRLLQIEETTLQIQIELLEIEKQKLEWQKLCKEQDQELEKMRMENEVMKLVNERMALELKQTKIEAKFKQ